MGLLLGGVGGWIIHGILGAPDMSDSPVIRAEIPIADDRFVTAAALSPDARWLAYATALGGQVWLKNLETGDERVVVGTEDIIEIEFSPDGEWIVFDDLETIYRAPIEGGRPTALMENLPPAPHSSWVSNDEIVFDGNESGIFVYRLDTGEKRLIIEPDSSAGHVRYLWPNVSDDGSKLLVRVVTTVGPEFTGVYSWPDGELLHLERWSLQAGRFVGPRHVAGVEAGNLMVRAFDPGSGDFAGPPVQLAEWVSSIAWDVTSNGLLLTRRGEDSNTDPARGGIAANGLLRRGTWDLTAQLLPVAVQRYYDPDVSPDGSRLAVEIGRLSEEPEDDIWVIGMDDGVANQLTSGNTGNEPTWTSDGDSILYVNRQNPARSSLEIMAADGSGRPRVIYERDGRIEYPDISADGTRILFASAEERSGLDIQLLHRSTGIIEPAATGTGRQSEPRFSPDGRYFSFTDVDRIVVKTTALDGSEWDVSQGEGTHSRWSEDGGFIYFLRDGELHRIPVDASDRFRRVGSSETSSIGINVAFSTIPGSDDLLMAGIAFQGIDDWGTDYVDIETNIFRRIEQLAPGPSR